MQTGGRLMHTHLSINKLHHHLPAVVQLSHWVLQEHNRKYSTAISGLTA